MPARPEIEAEFDQEPTTVLVVEDEVLVRLALADFLRDCGYKVVEAANAQEAIQALTASDQPVSVVFSDVNMPGEMDGFSLASWVRKHKPDVKILLTSGHAHAAQIASELCEAGPLVPKPYQYSNVFSRIKRLLARTEDQ
jgi:CheY-like chemotaxis protein